jgi:hypothetical protein
LVIASRPNDDHRPEAEDECEQIEEPMKAVA